MLFLPAGEGVSLCSLFSGLKVFMVRSFGFVLINCGVGAQFTLHSLTLIGFCVKKFIEKIFLIFFYTLKVNTALFECFIKQIFVINFG